MNIKMSSIIEKHVYQFNKLMANYGDSEYVNNHDVEWIYTKQFSWPNMIFNAQLNENNVNSRIHFIIEKIQNNEAPGLWIIGPTSKPENINIYLQEHEFKKIFIGTGMAFDHSKLIIDNNNLELTYRKVSNKSDLYLWYDILLRGLFINRSINIKIFINLLKNKKVILYLGLYNNIAVATSMQILFPKVSGIFFVSVPPEYRNNGYGSAITRIPMVEAQKAGYNYTILSATEIGKPIYLKMGFKEYFINEMYIYKNSVS